MPNPVKVTLEVGKEYAWCCCEGYGLCDDEADSCELSAQIEAELTEYDPLHTGGPVWFTADRTEAMICTCKQTKTAPYCDGSHKTVKDE